MQNIKIILTNSIGIKKEVKFTADQVEAILKVKGYQKRLKAIADHYSRDYWVDVIVNGKNFYSVQWSEL